MEIYTIGFTKRSAEAFFGALATAQVQRILDTRLRPDSQLAGYTRARDMPFFANRLLAGVYEPLPILAPTTELLDAYRTKRINWNQYATVYTQLLDERRVTERLERGTFMRRSAFLCSEYSPERCHRRIAAEYLAERWGNLSVIHL